MESRLITMTLCLIFVQLIGLLVEFEILDPFRTKKNQDLAEHVGFVERKERQVRRRSASSPLWEDTEKHSPLWNYDSVLTLKESSARLHLSGGTKVDLSENTLVVLDPSTDSENAPLRLRFFKGELRAIIKARNQNIQTEQWAVEPAQGTDMKITSLDSDRLELEVRSGEVKIFPTAGGSETSAVSGSPVAISSGQRIEIQGARAGQPTAIQEDLTWTAGDHLRVYSHTEPVEVELQWEGDAAQIEWISSDLAATELKNDQRSHRQAFPYGVYRARLKTASHRDSSTLKIEVWKAAKHYLTSPLPRDRAQTGRDVIFTWTPNPLAERYRLTLKERSPLPATLQETAETTAETPIQTLRPQLEGNYNWQVDGVDALGFTIPAHYSQEIHLLRDPLAPPILRGPSLRSPGSTE